MPKVEISVPRSMDRLPRNKAGYVVPWFVAWIDGEPDFRVVGPGKVIEAIRFDLCWLCGRPRGVYGSFVIGPMCAINRVSAEPPSHKACAEYAAQMCPFLANPNMVRRETGLDNVVPAPGITIRRNPGVALVWTSRTFSTFRAPAGVLFDVGEPVTTAWYAHGRTATREEILASISSGLPILTEAAEADGPDAVADLELRTEDAMTLLPAGVS